MRPTRTYPTVVGSISTHPHIVAGRQDRAQVMAFPHSDWLVPSQAHPWASPTHSAERSWHELPVLACGVKSPPLGHQSPWLEAERLSGESSSELAAPHGKQVRGVLGGLQGLPQMQRVLWGAELLPCSPHACSHTRSSARRKEGQAQLSRRQKGPGLHAGGLWLPLWSKNCPGGNAPW